MKFIQTIGLLALVAVLTACNGEPPENDAVSVAAAPSSATDASASKPSLVLPAKEQQLTELTRSFSRQYELATEANPIVSDQKVEAVNRQYDAEICKFANTLHVTGWVGTVYQIGLADGDDSKSAYLQLVLTARGSAAVSVSSMLGTDHITLSSWSDDRGDNDASLLAKPGTPLIDSLSTLKSGDVVVFDGDFQKIDGPGCLRTNDSIQTPQDNARASDSRPEFMFKFTKVFKPE